MAKTAVRTGSPTVLVTGGSGFVGQHVVQELSNREHVVVSLYHHRLPEQLDRVYPVCSDMSSPELLAAPLRGVDTVVHLAWTGGLEGPAEAVNWDPASPTSLPQNIQVLRNLIGAMERAGTRRLIFLSAIGASRKSRAPFLMEKYLAEFFILNSTIPEKVIVRSGIVWGGEASSDRFLRSLMRVMKYPVYPVPNKADGVCAVHIEELAPFLVRLVDQEMSAGVSVLEIGSETLTLDEIFEVVKERRIRKTRLPIRGFLGDSLLALFERDSGEARIPRLRDYLVISGHVDSGLRKSNPLSVLLPDRFATIRDRLTDDRPALPAVAPEQKPTIQ